MTSFTNTTRNYPTGADTPIRRVIATRDPTSTDNKNFVLGDEWLNKETQRWWKLSNLTATTAKWVPFSLNEEGAIETLTGDSGGAVGPDVDTGNVNLLGTAGQITVTGTPGTNTLTLALAGGGTAIDSITPGSGIVVVADGSGNINAPNGNGIATVGTLNTLTVNMASPFTGDFSFRSITSGDTETLTVTNTSNTASSQAQILASVAGTSAGDAWQQFTVGTTRSYAWGIDNSDSQKLKLNHSASGTVDPSSGTPICDYDPATDFFTYKTSLLANYDAVVGGFVQLGLQNTDAGNVDSAARLAITTQAGAGDPYISWDAGDAGAFWEMGIDNSAGSQLQIRVGGNAAVPNLDGTNVFQISAAGAITFDGAYTFPTADGTAGQALITNGAGVLSFGSTSSLYVYTAVAASPYVVAASDEFLSVNTGSAITIQLPNAPSAGRAYVIKDRTGTASANNITVTTVGGVVNIDGATSYLITNDYGSVHVLFNGTSYEVF